MKEIRKSVNRNTASQTMDKAATKEKYATASNGIEMIELCEKKP